MTEAKLSSNHPPLPPTTEDNRVSWLRLLRSRRVGVSTFFRLLGEHGSAEAALAALPDVAAAAGVRDYEIFPEKLALDEMRAARRQGAEMVCYGAADYPQDLLALADPPPFFWCRGRIETLHKPMVALIGARNASSLGLRMAKFLARDLGSEGLVTVSGLARGIDTAAHEASIETGTIGVLGGGVDVAYPPENAALMTRILDAGGALISEQPMGAKPMARHFPARNRIVSGLSKAVVVIEAAAKSGSLITARAALDQGREVMAVPGHPFDARAGGCNMLIADGARIVRSARDVMDGLPPALAPLDLTQTDRDQAHSVGVVSAEAQTRSLRDANDLHQQILDRLGPSPVQEDQLIRDLKSPVGQINPVLTDLELDGQIRRDAGGFLSLISK